MPDGPVVALVFLVVGGVLAALYFYVDYRRHPRGRHHVREAEPLPLFGTEMLATRGEDGSLHVDADARPAVRRFLAEPRAATPATPPTGPSGTYRNGSGGTPSFTPQTAGGPATIPTAPARTFASRVSNAAATATVPSPADSALVNGETLRFAVADEGTLRFLPGRLEVSAGPDAGREVRFVAPPGGAEPVEVTFGRTEGPAYRHVQLLARTVSRRHASMSLSDGHWSLQNLSATNPVILNGRPLAADEVAPLLVDGDRIEMGEVVFTFHSR